MSSARRTPLRALLYALVVGGLTGSLLVASPAVAAPGEGGGKPSVQDSRSAKVNKVGRSSLKIDDQTREAARKPRQEPVFPADGEAAIVPVDGSWSTSTELGVSVRSEDPANAPENIAVKVVGKSSEDGVGGGGLVLEVTPTKDTAASAGQANDAAPSPSPADQPTASPDASIPTAEPTGSPGDVAQSPAPEPTSDAVEEPTLKPETGFTAPVEVRVDYGKFATASGGDWASRLKLMLVQDCKAAKGKAKDKKVDCEPAATPAQSAADDAGATSLQPPNEDEAASLESTNDTEEQTVSAVVPAETLATGSPTMFAVAAADSGSTGTYAATPLNPASSWSSGGHTGDFAWSHPIATPPGVNGPEPDLSIEYSSSSVDGRMRSKNSQTSWVGEGFSLDPGFIERTYRTCAADNSGTSNAPADSQDLCWVGEYLDISLGGKTSKLIRDGSSSEFRLQQDDGTRVKRMTGATNGDNNGEYWEVTTPDGTKYYYGRERRFAGDTQDADSAATVPVYGNNDGDPCNGSTFAGSDCKQAWRWSLDYVVDTNGNSMSLFYVKETNYFGSRNNTSVKLYDRAQHLTRIEYGTRAGAENGTAPVRVRFELKPRCVETVQCAEGWKAATAEYWPDSPRDRVCNSSSSCSGRVAPTFFTPNRLGSIVTEVREGGGYLPVNSWTLKHSFPNPSDGTDPALWLEEITPAGKVGSDLDLPPVKFFGVPKDNRVNKDGDGAPAFRKFRVSGIENGTGGLTSITYSGTDCSSSSKPSSSSLHSNDRRCFPVWYSSEDVQPRLDFFHKYVAEKVTESDGLDGTPDVVTDYGYNGGGAWHYYEDKALNSDYRTWGQWRGFKSVSTRVGADEATQVYENTLYMRGMDGDKKQGGGTTDIEVTDGEGESAAIEDFDHYAGFPRRTRTTLSDSDGEVVDIEVNEPWRSGVTASYGDQPDARMVDVKETQTKTRLSDGSYRTAKESTTYNSYGQPTQVEDSGDTAKPEDDTCTKTAYAENTAAWILELPSVETTTAGDCSAGLPTATNLLASARTSYDGLAHGVAPAKGNVTASESATGTELVGGAIAYQVDATIGYDDYGRVTSEKNALDEETKTSYAMTDGLPTSVTATNPKTQTTTTKLNKAWGTPDQVTDVAGGKTDYEYDPLGRVTKVWVPGREKASGKSPTHKFAYTLSATAPNVVTAERLQSADDTSSAYVPTYTFYDGLLRERSTQTPAAGPDGGRLITEKIYDSHGRVASERGPTYNIEPAAPALRGVSEAESEAYTNYTYDRASRVIAEAFGSLGTEKWRTTTAYGGDRVSVNPPDGGTPTTTIFDVRGQTTKLLQHNGDDQFGPADETAYTYTLRGELATITNAADNTWTNKYDIRGNLTEVDDPDRGVTTTTFDALDRPESTEDAKNQTLWTKYDSLGRKTELRNDDASGGLRASWVYDTIKPGLLTSSTRHAGGGEYTTAVESYDAAGRPTATKLTIPSSEGELSRPGGYVETTDYTATGLIDSINPADAPGLPNGDLQFDYDLLGNPTQGPGVGGVTYSPYGEVLQRTLGSDPNQVFDTRTYEVGTRRLETHKVDLTGTTPQQILDQEYGYDEVGNITSLSDAGAGETDRQCFDYDYLRRLTEAWSSSTTDCGAPTDSTLGSVAPYWDQYEYDKSGNRTQWTAKTKAGKDPVRTSTHNYALPAGTDPRPHATTADVATGDGAYTENFGYDANGSMTSRTKGENVGQDISWDREGHQASVTDKASGKKTEYLYDADGNRLIERDETADTTTLYVGGTEYVLKDGAVTATRNLDGPGGPALTQTATGDKYVIGDAQSTGLIQIDETTLDYTKRRFTPFGGSRGASATWDGGRGFLNQPTDPTGTTHLGAREYDPGLGRFLSVDPILDPMDPQQANGYSYANNSPVTKSDPNGLFPSCGGGCGADRGSKHANDYNYNGTFRKGIKKKPASYYQRAAKKFTVDRKQENIRKKLYGNLPNNRKIYMYNLERRYGLDTTPTRLNNHRQTFMAFENFERKQGGAPKRNWFERFMMNPTAQKGGFIVGTLGVGAGVGGSLLTRLGVRSAPAKGATPRFVVNGAGEVTLHLRQGSGSLEVTEHAAKALTQRNISIDAAETALKKRPFQYFHDDVWKMGYYDPGTKVFLGSVQGRVTTVIDNVKPGYISNLRAVTP